MFALIVKKPDKLCSTRHEILIRGCVSHSNERFWQQTTQDHHHHHHHHHVMLSFIWEVPFHFRSVKNVLQSSWDLEKPWDFNRDILGMHGMQFFHLEDHQTVAIWIIFVWHFLFFLPTILIRWLRNGNAPFQLPRTALGTNTDYDHGVAGFCYLLLEKTLDSPIGR